MTPSYRGMYVFLQRMITDPSTDSSYYDGEYFVVQQHGATLNCVKPVAGYLGHELKTFHLTQYRVLDAHRCDDEARDLVRGLRHFAGTLARGEKAQWIASVYDGAAASARMVDRALEGLPLVPFEAEGVVAAAPDQDLQCAKGPAPAPIPACERCGHERYQHTGAEMFCPFFSTYKAKCA